VRHVPGHRLRKEVLDGVQMQADKLKIKVVETTTHKPTTRTFTAQITRLKAAGCDLVVARHHRARLHRAVRDGAEDRLDRRRFPRLRGQLRPLRRRRAGRGHGGPVRDGPGPTCRTATPSARPRRPWFDRYKERYKNDPNIGAIYGHVAADLTALGLEKAGADLTLTPSSKGWSPSAVTATSSTAPSELRPRQAPGRELVVPGRGEGGRWVRLTDPLGF